MKRKLVRLFKSSCDSTTVLDLRFKYVYINDILRSSDDNGAYLIGYNNNYTLFLWQQGMLMTKNPLILSKDNNIDNPKIGIYLKDDDNRKFFISEDLIIVFEEGLITEYTNKKT